MNKNLRSVNNSFLKGMILCAALLILSTAAFSTVIYSSGTGNWTSTTSWQGGVVPADGDTVVIQSGHTISITATLYNNSTYMFLIIAGALDLTNNGKLRLDGSSKVIIETGGSILGNGSSDQLSIGTGGAEYSGNDGTITGPSYVSNGHSPSTGEGTAGCGCYTPGVVPLPITLLFFDGETGDGIVTLFWATVTEKNFDKFIIERSSDGLSFVQIGTVPGAGYESKIRIDYSYLDRSPAAGRNYYRLKSVDNDGTVDYSDVIVLTVAESAKNVSVFPNPSNGQAVEVRINFEPQTYDRIQVIDNLGATLFELPVTGIQNQFQLNDRLEKGVYLLRFVSLTFIQTVRLTVN